MNVWISIFESEDHIRIARCQALREEMHKDDDDAYLEQKMFESQYFVNHRSLSVPEFMSLVFK